MINQLKVIDGCIYSTETQEWVSIDSLEEVNKIINYYEGK